MAFLSFPLNQFPLLKRESAYVTLLFLVLFTYNSQAAVFDEISSYKQTSFSIYRDDKNVNTFIYAKDDNEFQAWIDEAQDSISDSIHSYGSSFDHFIGKTEDEKPMQNRSYLKIKFKPRYSHREYSDIDASIKLKIDLPHTEKRWKVIFETDPDDFDRLEDKQRGISNSSDSSLSGAVGGFRLQDRQWGNWNADFDVGLKIKLPLDPFTRANVHRVDKISRNWTTRIKQEVFYFHNKGPGAITSFNFYFSTVEDPDTILKLSSNAQFLDEDDNWEFVQQAEIFDRVNESNLLQYSIGISADSRPNYSITNSWVSIGWKHRLYKDWLYLTVTPELDFQDEFNYKINPGVMLELEMFFTAEGGIDRLARKIPTPTL
ncbi:hypothetical protein L4D09_00005 [Photobacterium makurazakiensis]|uniref:hypothetical protein n=1 Tax=Photobacterium makurazakiensis TaxID=2910234 RepID=UPI003D10A205